MIELLKQTITFSLGQAAVSAIILVLIGVVIGIAIQARWFE